jgi:hypothetical protein
MAKAGEGWKPACAERQAPNEGLQQSDARGRVELPDRRLLVRQLVRRQQPRLHPISQKSWRPSRRSAYYILAGSACCLIPVISSHGRRGVTSHRVSNAGYTQIRSESAKTNIEHHVGAP